VKPPFANREDAVSYLDKFQFHGFRLGLERINAVLKALGEPQASYPCIHVAGTNGKGSVCAALASVLQEAGFQVGLYSSPHLVRLNERFRLNMESVTDEELTGLINDVATLVEEGFELSYFEFTTAMAFLWFAKKEVDIAIVETGLGGRLDATNVITPLVSAITNIALEHQAYLGDTISDISREKAGIIKEKVPVVTGRLCKDADFVITKVAKGRNAPLRRLGTDFKVKEKAHFAFDYLGLDLRMEGLRFGLLGGHQLENAAVALASLEELARQGFEIGEDALKRGLASTFWPGRSEFLQKGDILVLLEGAHNMAGVNALKSMLSFVQDMETLRRPMYILWACSDEGGDKDVSALLKELAPFFKAIVVTEPQGPRKPVTIEQWKALAPPCNPALLSFEKDWRKALDKILGALEQHALLVVSGSLYLVGPARQRLLDARFGRARLH